MNIHNKVKQVFVAAFNLPADSEFESIQYGKVDYWDSTAHMVLIAELEAAFDIMLSTDDVLALSSFPRAIEIVQALIPSEASL